MGFPFNVRAYGALVHEGHLLLSKETYQGKSFTKLPGGGLEFGEGLKDTVAREFLEETGLKVNVVSHLYTTDFFQASAFDASHQIISVYYRVTCDDMDGLRPVLSIDETQVFFWKLLNKLEEADFTFPIDKRIVDILKRI